MGKARPEKQYLPQHHLFHECKGHSNHMCELVAKRKMNKVLELAQEGNHICQVCGRTAGKATNLCSPIQM